LHARHCTHHPSKENGQSLLRAHERRMMTSTALLLSIVISACSVSLVAANYQDGEFVPTARRAQFHGVHHSAIASSYYVF